MSSAGKAGESARQEAIVQKAIVAINKHKKDKIAEAEIT